MPSSARCTQQQVGLSAQNNPLSIPQPFTSASTRFKPRAAETASPFNVGDQPQETALDDVQIRTLSSSRTAFGSSLRAPDEREVPPNAGHLGTSRRVGLQPHEDCLLIRSKESGWAVGWPDRVGGAGRHRAGKQTAKSRGSRLNDDSNGQSTVERSYRLKIPAFLKVGRLFEGGLRRQGTLKLR